MTHKHRWLLLCSSTRRVLSRGEPRGLTVVSVFRQFKGIDEADPVEGLIVSRRLVKLMLDVHRRDVVGQQHHLVAVEFGRDTFPLSAVGANLAHRPHDEIARPHKRIDDVNTGIGERSIEFGP